MAPEIFPVRNKVLKKLGGPSLATPHVNNDAVSTVSILVRTGHFLVLAMQYCLTRKIKAGTKEISCRLDFVTGRRDRIRTNDLHDVNVAL